jgi:hypothetical protein
VTGPLPTSQKTFPKNLPNDLDTRSGGEALLAGVVTALGYGTTGLSVGQRVLGLTDWHRDGTLAEYAAVEAHRHPPKELPAIVSGRVTRGKARRTYFLSVSGSHLLIGR